MNKRIERIVRREEGEPDELRNPVPWPLALMSVLLIGWGAWYYFQNVGYPLGAGDRRSAAVVPSADAVDGQVVYGGNCAACHQQGGAGLPGVFPPLINTRWVLGDEQRLVQILLHGIQGEIEVAGATYNGVMPAFGQLSDAELAAVLTYIRGAWGNTANPISVDDIQSGRERYADRSQPWAGGAELDAEFPQP